MLTDFVKELNTLSDEEIEQFELALKKRLQDKLMKFLKLQNKPGKNLQKAKRMLRQRLKKLFSGLETWLMKKIDFSNPFKKSFKKEDL